MHDAHVTRYMRLKIERRQAEEWADTKREFLCFLIGLVAVGLILCGFA